jgi:hypothetical protein
MKIELPFDPAIPLLDKYLKGLKSGPQGNKYSSMFVEALFITPKTCVKRKSCHLQHR